MMQKQTTSFIAILDYFFHKIIWLVNVFFTLWYFGRKKTVLRPQDPVLLKSATQLAEEIRKGKLKSEEVVNAYIRRIVSVQPLINAITQQCFEDALKKAKAVDELIATGNHSEEKLLKEKPLLGVPISIKALFPVKGFRSTACSKLYKDVQASESAPCVSLVQGAGAIVIAITNTPEFGFKLETSNLLHGRTSNPYDTTRTCGASSGGEGALIAAAGSVIGLGNDLLGSVRLPAHFSGIFAHKPSKGLVPNECFPAVDHKVGQYVYTGPMCRYAEDLKLTMSVLSSQSDTRLKFTKEVDFKKLKVYYLLEINDHLTARVDNAIKQGVKRAAFHFTTKYGATTKQVQMPSMRNLNTSVHHMIASPLEDLKMTLAPGKGDNIDERWDLIKALLGRSTFDLGTLMALNFWKLPVLYNENRVPRFEKKMANLIREFEDLLDEDSVLLMPTFPVSAPYHNQMYSLFMSCGYTALFNVIGLPSTQCPIGMDEKGMPYGLQIVGKMKNDPLTIACAVELEKAFGGWVVVPGK